MDVMSGSDDDLEVLGHSALRPAQHDAGEDCQVLPGDPARPQRQEGSTGGAALDCCGRRGQVPEPCEKGATAHRFCIATGQALVWQHAALCVANHKLSAASQFGEAVHKQCVLWSA